MKASLRIWLRRWNGRSAVKHSRRPQKLARCLTVALATAWGGAACTGAAAAATVHLEVTPTQTLTTAYAVYYNKNSSGVFSFPLGTLPAGQTTSFDHDFPFVDPSAFDPSPPFTQYWEPVGYGIVGLFGEGDATGATFSFQNSDAIDSGATFESLFTAQNGFTEASFISTLNSFPTFAGSWVNTFDHLLKVPYGSQATLVNFSTAAFGGTAIATVPEPAGWVLLVLGGGAFFWLPRRRASCPS